MGLARDGGLLVPERLPSVSEATLEQWQRFGYQQLALELLSLFIDDIGRQTLNELIESAYAHFDHPQEKEALSTSFILSSIWSCSIFCLFSS